MKCTFFSRIWHQNETEIFLKEVLSKFGKNKEFKIHQTSTGRIKANLQLFADNGEKLKKPLREKDQRQEKKVRYFRAGN